MDELPQLLDILSGHMSLIGPRPALWNQDVLTAERDRYGANDVRPGLTGWAQVHGRNSASWKKRFEYDIYYVDHCSFGLDVKTIFQTVAVVFKHEGIAQGEERPESFNTVRQREWDEGTVIRDR